MLGKGVKLSDCLLAIALVLPAGAAVGALLGFAGNRGLSRNVGTVIMVAFVVLAGRFAQAFVRRRVKARSGPETK